MKRSNVFQDACASIVLMMGTLFVSCGGRTSLLHPECSLTVSPASLDFGEVEVSKQVGLSVTVSNTTDAACHIARVQLQAGSDPTFALAERSPPGMTLRPGEQTDYRVTFKPAAVAVPLERTGTLVFSSDAAQGTVEVPLTGYIHSNCRLAITPGNLDFGQVHLDGKVGSSVHITNTGSDACMLDAIALAPDSDPQFGLGPLESTPFEIPAGRESKVTVTFHAKDQAAPFHRTGRLDLASTDPQHANVTIPLSADVDVGCVLSISPPRVDFGRPILNNTVDASLTLVNQGSQSCHIASLSMTPGSDSGFALGPSQARALELLVGDKENVALRFEAFDSSPPHRKNATLLIDSDDRDHRQIEIPLFATIDTVCVEASRWIYTVDKDTTLSRFDPATLTFTDIGKLKCDGYSPFSMAVDQNAVAWVEYEEGRLHKVDTSTGQCEMTRFVDVNFKYFGMGFMFDPATGQDTLYIAGGPSSFLDSCTLATISFPSLKVNSLGPIAEGWPELSGTGDGELWGFYPALATGTGTYQATLARLDPRNGAALESHHYPEIGEARSWTMKFWGGQFWLFVDNAIYAVDRKKPEVVRNVVSETGRNIVGAGVSSCAPIK